MDRRRRHAAAGPDAQSDDRRDHRHADDAGHVHVHGALRVDSGHHRLPDGDDHRRRRRRRRERRRRRAARRVPPVAIGDAVPFTLNVSNAGPAAATNVRLTDTLPAGTHVRQRDDDGRVVSAGERHAHLQSRHARQRRLRHHRAHRSSDRRRHAHQSGRRLRRSGRSGRDEQHGCSTASTALPSSRPARPSASRVRRASWPARPTRLSAARRATSTRTASSTWYSDRRSQYRRHPARQRHGRIRRADGDSDSGTPNDAAVADFNNDGHLDVVISRNARRRGCFSATASGVSARRPSSAADHPRTCGGRSQPRRQRRPGGGQRRPARDDPARQRQRHVPASGDDRHGRRLERRGRRLQP